ncbi:hypothetical protein PHLCEN_2v1027 [Hermanssonia centrifuga]|uniref:Uncharacterized protein n=1 Tax=Hermanssonia centrifuga TaxID=98765 RepID=A0A2R6S4D5_9APHY|nr:hypothetical protein PHLCEN_2v1027 [Hermanssonia centrifuga]
MAMGGRIWASFHRNDGRSSTVTRPRTIMGVQSVILPFKLVGERATCPVNPGGSVNEEVAAPAGLKSLAFETESSAMVQEVEILEKAEISLQAQTANPGFLNIESNLRTLDCKFAFLSDTDGFPFYKPE